MDNVKKQFFRVKQLADQTLRGDKSKAQKAQELQIADQKFEYLRNVLSSINKKLPPQNGYANDGEKRALDLDKRMKKCLDYQVGSVFKEHGARKRELLESDDFFECKLLQDILLESGEVQQTLAKDFAEHEQKVEEMFSVPIQTILENDFSNISGLKKNLKKYQLDKDSASSRYHANQKETLKEEMDEADTKVELTRDTLAVEMFNVIAKENDFATYVLQYLKLQRAYHESAVESLRHVIPELERRIGSSSTKRVFGVPLQEHLRVTGKRIAYPLEICISTLSEIGMSEEGLFRIQAGSTKTKRLKLSIDSGCFSALLPEYRDCHVLANVLKQYLRELPEPLLTYSLYSEWMQVKNFSETDRIERIRFLLTKLPRENMENLTYLCQFLWRLSQNPANKMVSTNISIVISPNLLWDKEGLHMEDCASLNMLVELFISEANLLFTENVEQHVKIMPLLEDDLKYEDLSISTESLQIDSPRPNTRKKKHAAPVPPLTSTPKSDIESSTLRRKKDKEKHTVGTNTDVTIKRISSFNCKDTSFSGKDSNSGSKDAFINQNNKASTDQKEQHLVKNEINAVNTVNTIKSSVEVQLRPVAAPRNAIQTQSIGRSSSMRSATSKQEPSNEQVTLRRPETQERLSKPEIPARPVTLLQKRSSFENAESLQKTHASVYSVPNKQQPSFVDIRNKNERLGHDNHISKKEIFLGHCKEAQPNDKVNQMLQQEKVFPLHQHEREASQTQNQIVPKARIKVDVNSNSNTENKPTTDQKPNVPPKCLNLQLQSALAKSSDKLSTLAKSTEKLNESEKVNGNVRSAGHTRTRSDGNIIDFGESLVKTPASPRSVNKPSQPPPPPPGDKENLPKDKTEPAVAANNVTKL